ncbi:MAG: LLM class flavin-dependent oxidoreductase [Chloroflexi bacterium]|nr:LLM class flavin-dependent oxidoreductase [Chloroflexota bacterium]
MRFGTYYFLQAPPGRAHADVLRDEVDQMVLAEQLGYDSIWLTEHHYADYGLSSAPSVLLATVAARTQRIRLAIAVYVIPFHHPLRLAEETAALDILSGGRLTVGIGRGNRPLEFYGHGLALADNRSRMEEATDILLQAWTQERVTFHGKHWDLEKVPVWPKPVQHPHPPLAVAVTSPESIAWAARRGFGMLSSGLTTPLANLQANRQRYVDELQAAGQPMTGIESLLDRWVVTKHVHVAPTDAEAREAAEPAERWYLDSFARSFSVEGIPGLPDSAHEQSRAQQERMRNMDFEALLRDPLLVGSPDTVARKVADLRASGVAELACWMSFGGLTPEQVRRSMRLFADDVAPAFR